MALAWRSASQSAGSARWVSVQPARRHIVIGRPVSNQTAPPALARRPPMALRAVQGRASAAARGRRRGAVTRTWRRSRVHEPIDAANSMRPKAYRARARRQSSLAVGRAVSTMRPTSSNLLARATTCVNCAAQSPVIASGAGPRIASNKSQPPNMEPAPWRVAVRAGVCGFCRGPGGRA